MLHLQRFCFHGVLALMAGTDATRFYVQDIVTVKTRSVVTVLCILHISRIKARSNITIARCVQDTEQHYRYQVCARHGATLQVPGVCKTQSNITGTRCVCSITVTRCVQDTEQHYRYQVCARHGATLQVPGVCKTQSNITGTRRVQDTGQHYRYQVCARHGATLQVPGVCKLCTFPLSARSEDAVTWKQDPADHAWDDPEEQGEDLESPSQHTPTLHVRHVAGGQTPLDHDLTTHG